MSSEIIKLIGLVLGGGTIGAFLTYKLSDRKQDTNDFATLVKEYKELVDDYKKELSDLKTEVDALKKAKDDNYEEIVNLRNQLLIFESSHVDIPVPIWLKDINGKMLFVNQEYERAILHPIGKSSKDYIGHTDIDVWRKEVGKKFIENDRKVVRYKKAIEFTEEWEGLNGQKFKGRLIKYPRFINNKTVIGIGGIIIEMITVE